MSADDGASQDDTVENEDVSRFTEEEVITILTDECDGEPHRLLQHNEARYRLAEWKANPVQNNFAYESVMEEINWRGVEMRKKRFENTLDDIWNQMESDGTSDESVDEQDAPNLSADEFYEAFDWDDMQDREMARKCHFWVKENADIIFTNDRVLTYDDGIWTENEGRVALILQQLLREHYGRNVLEEFKQGYIRAHPEYQVDWDEIGIRGSRVAVENGLLDLTESEIERSLEPGDYAIMRLPVEWQGMDAESPRWDRFVTQSVAPRGRKTLQEFSGLLLHTNEYPFKKAMMLLGGGDNGKGVYENVMTALLGKDNVSHDDLTEMAGAQYGLQRLRHKTANINSDIEGGRIEETSMLKKLTGNDRVRVKPKYETPFGMENPAKLVFAANAVPKVKDAELAFYRRWLFVQFPHRFTTDPDDEFKNAIRDLDEKIIENELPGVLAWAVEGYQRLQEQDHFTDERNAEEIREQWHNYSDTTATFIRNYVMAGDPRVYNDSSHRMRVDEMYDLYQKYIETTPTAPKSKQKLSRYITTQYEDAETTASRKAVYDDEDVDTVRVWDGVFVPREKRDEIRQR